MKKTFYHIGMLAAAALAFIACNKEVEFSYPEEITHVATISLGKAIDTKTEVIEGETEATYKWLDGDQQYLHVYENGVEGTITEFSLNSDKTEATLTVSFTGTPSAPYTYTAKYAKTLSGSKNPLIPNEQNPGTTSFDPAADVLVSKATTDVTNLDERATEFSFTMGRIATINKMTLTGLEEGEIISKVEFTLDKNVAGNAQFDQESSAYEIVANHGKKLILNYEGNLGTVPANGQFPVYFVAFPVEAAAIESVVVTTDKHVYTKPSDAFTGKTITFAVGTMKRFTMAMAGYGEEISDGTVYTLVQSEGDLYDGATYLIYCNGYVLGEQKANNRGVVEVSAIGSEITIDNTLAVYPVIIESVEDGYAILDITNNGYLYNDSGSKNNLRNKESKDTFTSWTISVNNGIAHITNVNTEIRGIMGYNPNNGSPLFAAYGTIPNGGTSNLALYVDKTTCVEPEESGLAYDVTSPIEVSWDDKDGFVKPTLSNPNALTVTYSSSDKTVATVNESTGDITFIGNGTTTITASSPRTKEYKAGSAQYQITVTGAPANKGSVDNPYTASEARAAAIALAGEASSNEVYVKGIVSEITTEYSTSFNNVTFNISDDGLTTSDQFEAYREKSSYSSSVAAGDAVVVKGTIIYYKSTTPEFQADNAIQSLLAKPVISGEDSFTTESTSVTLTAAEGSTIYYTIDGTNPTTNSSVYSGPISISATTTVKAIAVKDGLVTGIASKDFTFIPSYPVQFETPSNGTIVVKHGETTLTSGATVAVGETITITTTPSSGYVLSTLVYNDGSDHDIKATKSFTMPDHAVSITASFTESIGGTMTIDFESDQATYSDWTFTTIVTRQTNDNAAHGGTYFGSTNGKTSGNIQTKNKIEYPSSISFFVSKTSNNNTASSWIVEVSSNGSSWTKVGDSQSASAGITRGEWTEVTRDLSSYTNVYVRVRYDGTSAVRTIDDIALSYN